MRHLPWLGLFAAYVAVALLLDPGDPPPQVPLLLERLREATSADVVAVVLAVPAAVSFALAAALARRWVPDPWATRGVLIAAVSAPAFALPTHARPDAIAAALLLGGLLLALRTRDEATRARTLAGAACLSLAPWFGLPYAAAALPVLLALYTWTRRRGRPLLAFLAIEIGAASAVALGAVEQPASDGRGDLTELLLAPVLLLTAYGIALLVRSRREHVSRAIAARRDAEVAAAITTAMAGLLVAGAALGPVGPGAALPFAGALAAWGLQRAPRAGAAIAVLTVALMIVNVR